MCDTLWPVSVEQASTIPSVVCSPLLTFELCATGLRRDQESNGEQAFHTDTESGIAIASKCIIDFLIIHVRCILQKYQSVRDCKSLKSFSCCKDCSSCVPPILHLRAHGTAALWADSHTPAPQTGDTQWDSFFTLPPQMHLMSQVSDLVGNLWYFSWTYTGPSKPQCYSCSSLFFIFMYTVNSKLFKAIIVLPSHSGLHTLLVFIHGCRGTLALRLHPRLFTPRGSRYI